MNDLLTSKLGQALLDLPDGINRRVVCPLCNSSRKHKGDRTLSLKREGDTILWNCWHCNESGRYAVTKDTRRHPVVEKQPPREPLSKAAIDWLASRGISEKTATIYGLYTTEWWFRKANRREEAVGFPFFNREVVYATKLRCLAQKDFSSAGAAQSFFGLTRLGDLDRIVITEGEIDALSLAEAGIENALAVPNGAPDRVPTVVSSPEQDKKFRYLWNAKDILDQVDRVYLAGDNDRPGEILMDELARRIGKHKCWRVRWPEGCKDANDVLVNRGPEVLAEAIESAERYPVSGLYEASSFVEDVEELYLSGKGKGQSTGYLGIDDIYTVVPGHLTVVTGIPSSGKSEFIDQIMVNLARRNGWRSAICSFENEPRYHIAKLIQKYNGKHFFPGPSSRMTKEELETAAAWVNEHFVFLHQQDGSLSDIESIIERLRVAVIRYGVMAVVIDPANYIDRPVDQSETQWVSDMLTRLRLFAQAHDIHVWLVAHPAKMHRDNGAIPVPRGYDISGSANYINKSDFGLTVHRSPDEPSLVEVHCWKARFVWAGKMGASTLVYNTGTTQYEDATESDTDPWYK